jgi:hypothetical protein
MISTIFLKTIGRLLGAKGTHQLTAKTFDEIMTPYVIRVWIELKNTSDKIENATKD